MKKYHSNLKHFFMLIPIHGKHALHFVFFHPFYFALLFILLFAFPTMAQNTPDTVSTENQIEQNVEDAITTSENDDETDWTVVTDYLNDLRK